MDPISRAQAAGIGATHFFTGRLCKNGHVAPRYVSTGNCTACQGLYSKKFRGDGASLSGFLPAQRMHPEDAEEVLKMIDFFNGNRGLPPAVRPGAMPTLPSEFEAYLAKEMRKPLALRPPLHDIERAAGVLGMAVEYRTMTRPVDTWSTRGPAPTLAGVSTSDPAVRAANEAHNAALAAAAEGAQAHPNVEARKAAMARALEADGYLPGEK